jgi:hypothetical protein
VIAAGKVISMVCALTNKNLTLYSAAILILFGL